MNIVVVDCEVFKYDWITIFLDTTTGEWSVFHNDEEGMRDYISRPGQIYCTFNGKHYDNFCMKAMCCGADPTLIKHISDFIITEKRNGWDHWYIRKNRFRFNNFDLADDTQQGTSLKHYEAHSFVDIEESEVDFNLDRPLTPEEIQSTIHYCKWDVWNTARLLTVRKGYLDTKLNVGRMIGLPDEQALYCTNALLTARALKAVATERYDEREYQYPDNLRKDLIPSEVLNFFDRIHDMSIPSSEYFKSSLVINIGECEVKIGFGGIHAAIPKYIGGDSE